MPQIVDQQRPGPIRRAPAVEIGHGMCYLIDPLPNVDSWILSGLQFLDYRKAMTTVQFWCHNRFVVEATEPVQHLRKRNRSQMAVPHAYHVTAVTVEHAGCRRVAALLTPTRVRPDRVLMAGYRIAVDPQPTATQPCWDVRCGAPLTLITLPAFGQHGLMHRNEHGAWERRETRHDKRLGRGQGIFLIEKLHLTGALRVDHIPPPPDLLGGELVLPEQLQLIGREVGVAVMWNGQLIFLDQRPANEDRSEP